MQALYFSNCCVGMRQAIYKHGVPRLPVRRQSAAACVCAGYVQHGENFSIAKSPQTTTETPFGHLQYVVAGLGTVGPTI